MRGSSVPAGSTGTTYSANAPALEANLLATIPADAFRISYFVQNQDVTDLQVVFDDGTGSNVSIVVLGAAAAAGGGGGSCGMPGMPHTGRIRIFSSSATAKMSARAW